MKSKLRKRREALNLRVVDLAVQSGVGVSTLWLIENGYSGRVSKETKEKIAGALGVKGDELFL